jgi:branched-chain amino acid transport system substrate-binding protein
LQRVYAKIPAFARILSVLFPLVLTAACSGGYHIPWGTSGYYNSGVVTNDPDSIPNIAWQTPDQRQVLVEQNRAYNQQQTVIPPAEGTQAETAAVPPVEKVAPVTHEKIAVSILLPLTGKKAAIGQSMLKAAQMALFDIGSANFELVPRDTKSTKEGAVAAAEAAVKNNASLILGPIFADDLKAIKPVVSESGTPVISFTTDWTLAGGNTYIMGFLPFTQVTRVVKYAQEHGYSKLAVYAPQTEYCDVVIRTLQSSSVSISHINRYSPQQLDLSALVKDFAATSQSASTTGAFDFDMLMLPLGSEGLQSLVTTLVVNGVDQKRGVKFIGTGLWDDAAIMNNPSLYGGWFSAPAPNLRADFESRFQENYGMTPQRLSSLAYDATALAAVLARSAQDSTPYTSSALTNPRGFAGIDGIFRFRPDGLSERGLAVLEIRPGKARVIDPAPTAFISSGS